MNAFNKSRALLLGAVVAVTTPALAYYYYAPLAEEEEITVVYGPQPVAEPTVTIEEPASTAEPAIPRSEPVMNVAAPPPVIAPVQEPPVTVYADRKSKDELINEDVVRLLANDSRLSGYIGVETRNQIVTLNGRLTTSGQTSHAVRVAQSVEGVREVRNLLRAKVGGNT